MNIEKLHQLFLNSKGVSTDTRNIASGTLFFALKGSNFNGNEFAQNALEEGASHAIVDEEQYTDSGAFILVENVLETLQKLASFHRKYLNIPIIGLTGSNGKTTTKELITAVLRQKYEVTATQGNLNNHIGVPLTLLRMHKNTEIGVVEMGANHPGEIAFLSQLAKPNFGYITNFGKAHLEGFGSLEGVIKAKSELYDFLKKQNEQIFINLDDPVQQEQTSYFKVFSFGKDQDADIVYEPLASNPFVGINYQERQIRSHLIGEYNINNIAAALALGIFFKVPIENIAMAIEDYESTNNRSQVIKFESNKIILDAYNANPTSMAAALNSFENLDAENKVVILGDMFEVGNSSVAEHQYILNRINEKDFKAGFLIGREFSKTKNSNEKIEIFETIDDFKKSQVLKKIKNSTILIKGSRGMALEKLIE